MAQTVAQAAALLDVLTNKNIYKKAINSEDTLRIAVVKEWVTEDEGTNQLFAELLSELSISHIKISEISLPAPTDQDGTSEFQVLMHELNEDLATYLSGRAGSRIRSLSDVVKFNIENESDEMQYFGQEFFEQALELGGRNASYKKLRSENLDWAINRVLNPGLADFDILIGQTYSPAWKSNLGGGDDHSSASWISMAPAIAGTPIGCLPMGLVDGLPVGVGVVSRANEEEKLVSAMAQIERVLELGVLIPTFIKN
jgi:amidase